MSLACRQIVYGDDVTRVEARVLVDSPAFPGFSFPNSKALVPWNDGVQLTARPVSIFRLAAVVLCALLVAGSSRCAPQSTTPDSHSADTQSDKPREGGQAPAVGGVNTGGAHPAVLDSEHRPITAAVSSKRAPSFSKTLHARPA